jgi:hypothetical protein
MRLTNGDKGGKWDGFYENRHRAFLVEYTYYGITAETMILHSQISKENLHKYN